MTADAETIRGREQTELDWDAVKKWAKSAFTKERMAEVLLLVSTLTVLGTLLVYLNRAMDSYVIVGF